MQHSLYGRFGGGDRHLPLSLEKRQLSHSPNFGGRWAERSDVDLHQPHDHFGEIYDVSQALVWLTGSVYGRSWEHLWPLLPWSFVFLPLTLVLARDLDALNPGDNLAQGLGSRVE